MRLLALIASLSILAGCSSPLPKPDPNQAWVDLYATGSDLLMANRLDDKRLNDGRYFQVTPGAHELEARFQFEVHSGGNIMSEPMQRTCEIRIRYDNFEAGKRYRMEARTAIMSAQAWLYDDQRNVLARSEILRCGIF